MSHLIFATPVRIVESTLIYTGRCFLFSLLLGLDTVNDAVIAVHNDIDGDDATKEVVPSNTYDASAMGINGLVLKFAKDLSTGLYIKVTNIGSGSVVVDYRKAEDLSMHTFR